jgi:Zn-dependent protease
MNLTFKLGSIPVRVDPSFLLVAGVLGSSNGLAAIVVWIPVVFVGVLLHELGHALVGRSFGLTPRIDLVGMGGLTSWTGGDGRKVGIGKRIAISLAGPLTGIAIGLAFKLLRQTRGEAPFAPPWDGLVSTIIWVNLGWGVLNLLPILPMDGGNVLLQSLNWFTKGRGEKPARIVSCGTAVVVGILAWSKGSTYGALLAGLFAVQNVQALRAASVRQADAPLRELLKSGFAALEGEPPAAVRIAKDVLSRATDRGVRVDAVRLLAFGYLLSRDWSELALLMESPASSAIGDDEMAKFEQAARELGRPTEGDRIAAVRGRRAAPTL